MSQPIHFPVFAGQEGDRITYVTKITYRQLVEAFDVWPSEGIPADLKLQRELLPKRTKDISEYIKNNDDFIFPEIIAIVDRMSFESKPLEWANNLGVVSFPATAFRYASDGQGRLTGIKEALNYKPELASHMIDIKFAHDEGEERNQQVFADINMTPCKPSTSQCITFDHRTLAHTVVKETINLVKSGETQTLKPFINYEKASVSVSSEHLWTVNQMTNFLLASQGQTKRSIQSYLKANEDKQDKLVKLQSSFFNSLFTRVSIFKDVVSHATKAQEVKRDSIVGTAVFLEALGIFMKVAMLNMVEQGNVDLEWPIIDNLNSVDYSQDNPEWIGRCKTMFGKFVKNKTSVNATAAYLVSQCDLPMPKELLIIESDVQKSRSAVLKDVA